MLVRPRRVLVLWIIPIDGDERRRATRRRPTCAHERRIHPLPLPALRVDPLSASARLRVEVHLHPSDERPPHKLGGRPRRVQVATQGEPVLQGAADEHENAGRSARSVPAVRQVGEAEGGGRPDGDRRDRGAVRHFPHRSQAREVGCDEQRWRKLRFGFRRKVATFRATGFTAPRAANAPLRPAATRRPCLLPTPIPPRGSPRWTSSGRSRVRERPPFPFPRGDSTRNFFARVRRFPG